MANVPVAMGAATEAVEAADAATTQAKIDSATADDVANQTLLAILLQVAHDLLTLKRIARSLRGRSSATAAQSSQAL